MISVALCTYNGERFVGQQIESILVQTIQDFEIIVSDDNSKDNTIEILKSYSVKDKRIKIITNEQNVGFKKNFERAISKCKGEYIALCDQDDIWLPNHLEVLLHIIGDKPMACGDALFIDEKDQSLNIKLSQREHLEYLPAPGIDQAYTIAFYRSAFQGASMLLKREFCSQCMPIPEKVEFHDLWFCLLSCFHGGFSYTYELVNHYRMHSKNVTGYHIKPKNRYIDSVHWFNILRDHDYSRREKMLEAMIEHDSAYVADRYKPLVREWLGVMYRHHNIIGRIINIPFYYRNYKKIFV